MENYDELYAAQRRLRTLLLNDPHRPTYHFVSPEGFCWAVRSERRHLLARALPPLLHHAE